MLKTYVDRYDGHGVVLKGQGEEPGQTQQSAGADQVSQMAKRATQKAFK